jgi:acyl-CoA thioester hydrolase
MVGTVPVNGFKLVVPVQVRFRDIDAFGHVNNAVYLNYCEQCRFAYFRQFGYAARAGDLPLILARAEVDFRYPARLEQEVRVGGRTVQLGEASFAMEHRIEADGVLAAEVKVVLVSYDYETARPAPIPDEMRRLIAEFEGIPERS